ncbi:hypothetical protein RFI_22792 [Reticulomyxa filosa]|uniref:Uncharacterized protein n=1 Tax=Reticulomyxa filosa TaxID=46433 RepID=X6MLP5_RETFI|nr:hypothetical protein RFI_22792 [Reticulomyxa filosa]|eukprot:ETO14576.1 hypothetical protein RFI_22792 [Reticulomyxa filosa]
MHELNAFVVVLSANDMNTRNCSKTNGQVHLNQHININILIMSCDTLLNVWRCDQCLQFYNDMAYESTLQICTNGLVLLKIEIIRILQSTIATNSNQSKKILQTKTSPMNMLLFTSCISLTFCKAATLRILINGEVEEMASMLPLNRGCNNQEQVCLQSIDPFTTSLPTDTLTTNAVQSNIDQMSNFAGYFECIVQYCNCDYAVPLLNGKWTSDTYVDTLSSCIAGTNGDRKFVVALHRPKNIVFSDRVAASVNDDTGIQRIRRLTGRGAHHLLCKPVLNY